MITPTGLLLHHGGQANRASPLPPLSPSAALVVSFFFFVSLFFSPIIASIPPYAIGSALVLVSALLMHGREGCGVRL